MNVSSCSTQRTFEIEWGSRGTAYNQQNILEEVLFGEGSIKVWGMYLQDLVTVSGILIGADIPGYHHGQRCF